MRKAEVIEEIFEIFEGYLRSQVCKLAADRSLASLLSQALNNATPEKRKRKLKLGGCHRAGTKTQIACGREI